MKKLPINGMSVGNHCSRVLMIGPDEHKKGGIAALARSLIEKWDYEHYDLTYIVSSADKTRPLKIFIFLWAVLEFCYRSITWHADIVHIHFGMKYSLLNPVIFAILAKLFKSKIVLHCHASRFDFFFEKSPQSVQQFIRWILNLADVLLVVSKSWQDYFQSINLKVPVLVLYNAVVFPEENISNQNRKPIVLTLGRLGQRKGTYDILQAIPKVIDAYPDAYFWLGGDGEISEVQAIIDQQAWRTHVRLMGWLRGDAKESTFRQVRIFLLPSYHEGIPIAILEAMAYGLPVVSCPVGGIPEVVSDNKNGFLVKPGDVDDLVDKLLLLLKNELLANELGEAGRELVRETYNINSLIKHLYAIYNSILLEKLGREKCFSSTTP